MSTRYDVEPSRAEKVAAEHNAKLAATMPLFAATGQMEAVAGAEVWTAEELQAKWHEHQATMEAFYANLRQRASERRAAVAGLVTAERLAELDRNVGRLHESTGMEAAYWGEVLRELAPDHQLAKGYR